jgi:hypothetical protein
MHFAIAAIGRRKYWLTAAFILWTSAALAQTDTACVAGTPIAKQSRTKLKHRVPAAGASTPTTILEMFKWKAPANRPPATRRSNSPIDPKESKVFALEGDLWRVVTEAKDCDFHLELTTPGAGPTADRVIVEVPQDKSFDQVRQVLLRQLAAHGARIGGPILKKAIRVAVTGLGFYDGFHFSNADPQRGHDHGTAFVGTLWELHPVWEIKF